MGGIVSGAQVLSRFVLSKILLFMTQFALLQGWQRTLSISATLDLVARGSQSLRRFQRFGDHGMSCCVPVAIIWILESLRRCSVAREEYWIEIDHLISPGFCLLAKVFSQDVKKCATFLFG